MYRKGKKGRRHQKAAVGEKEERPQGKRGRQGSSERLGITLKKQRLEKYPLSMFHLGESGDDVGTTGHDTLQANSC